MTGQSLHEAKRTALVLAAAQAFVGAATPITISMGGLAGSYLLSADKSLATLPVTSFNIGVALGALPAALIMRAVGRRSGFMGGSIATFAGGVLAAFALFQASFWMFAGALLLVGLGNSFVQQYRFAAADQAPANFKPRAIAWVLGGGVFAAIIGPQLAINTRELFAPVSFAGAFLSVAFLGVVGAFILSFLRLRKEPAETGTPEGGEARPLGVILRQPRFLVALFCGVATFALMSFVMTGAPLAIVGCGFSPDDATLGISWHVIAMFGPSFFTGHLITRFGKERVVAAGMFLLIGCALVALSGIALWQFWTALILLGIGWNFGFIGATAMVADCYRPSEKNKVQGMHDFLLFSLVAFSSLMSGQVYNAFGWDMLNWVIFPVTGLCLISLGTLALRRRRTVQSA
ncbi:MFS transporter [Nitratireductor basaltis]|uniref:Major facilitator superfamily MFS_1 n=1 Tax=Nitratireductor basaltis TaxID=472175 RepID=A0A084UBW5_9HYPH|nr:MFS transporter [Nitratireductor basaltis]KFB10451.1 Major facilitator superfamily MFS_1 precursor [Nitratireductor basaltis]